MAYDFMTLGPNDFESLVQDLLSAQLGVNLESFKQGKDDGIDLRHALHERGAGGDIIFQCKRYAPGKFSSLKKACKLEIEKIRKFAPRRYVLVTSLGLSPKNKRELLQILSPFCKSSLHILGAGELNSLLRRNPAVERAHFKLWIASTAVLERVINSSVFGRSALSVEAAKRQVCKFVVHKGFSDAREILEKRHHLMIVGNPGIGKTTLARMLLLELIERGFNAIWVVGNFAEALAIVRLAEQSEEKFAIIYDDFLGRLQFNEIRFGKNEEHTLLDFLEKCNRTQNVRVILTTREYILADAQRVHGALHLRASEMERFTLRLEDYTRRNRAQIVFNHLYFSDLPDHRLAAIVRSKVYRKIVSHQNFNPRVVESISTFANSRSMSDSDFLQYVEAEFENPAALWGHPFENEIDVIARQLLMVLWLRGGTADITELERAVLQLSSNTPPEEAGLRFEQALRQVEGNFIQTDRYPGRRARGQFHFIAQFQNPSVEEFIEGIARSRHIWLWRLAEVATTVSQVEKLAIIAMASTTTDMKLLSRLRAAGLRCEGAAADYLVNLSVHGSDSVPTWYPGTSSILRDMRTLLRIEAHFGADDERHRELMRRITTEDGWKFMLKRPSEDGAYFWGAANLIDVIRDCGFGGGVEAAALSALESVTLNWDVQADGAIAIGDLVEILRRVRPRNDFDAWHLASVQRQVAARVKSLREEGDADAIRWEVQELDSIEAMLGAKFASERGSLEWELREADGPWDPPDSPARSRDSDDISDSEMEVLFIDLLER